MEFDFTKISSHDDAANWLFNNAFLADLEFNFDNHRVIYAHSFILCCRSEQFCNNLKSSIGTLRSITIYETDISYESFYEFMKYIYTKNVKINPSNIDDLFQLSRTHKLADLEEKCIAEFAPKLSVNSTCKYLDNFIYPKYDMTECKSTYSPKIIELDYTVIRSHEEAIGQLFNNKYLADVEFKFKDNLVIYGHTFILCFRSRKFLNELETQIGQYQLFYITDVSHESYYEFLNYFYTKNLKINNSNIEDLLKLSKMHNLPDLEERCVTIIAQKFSVNTVLAYLEKSIHESYNIMKNEALKFIKFNFFQIIKEQTSITICVDCLNEILNLDETSYVDEYAIFEWVMKWANLACIEEDVVLNEEEIKKLGIDIRAIRFRGMNGTDFFKCVEKYPDTLSDDESIAISKQFQGTRDLDIEFKEKRKLIGGQWYNNIILQKNMKKECSIYDLGKTCTFSYDFPSGNEYIMEILMKSNCLLTEVVISTNRCAMNIFIVEVTQKMDTGNEIFIFDQCIQKINNEIEHITISIPPYLEIHKTYRIYYQFLSTNERVKSFEYNTETDEKFENDYFVVNKMCPHVRALQIKNIDCIIY